MSRPEGARYRFGPRERGGGLAGWRTGQILTVAVGLVFGVLVLRWWPDAAGVVAAVAVLLAYAALATVPVAGRTGDEWLPVVVWWGARRVRGRAARRAGAGVLGGMRLLEAGWRHLGVVHDRRARTLTAALVVRGGDFALLGPEEQDRRVAAWSAVLASLAREGSPVRRVQWVAGTRPEGLAGCGRPPLHALEQAGGAAPACRASYDALVADMDARGVVHDVLLAVQVRVSRSLEAGCAVLAREVAALAGRLGDADVEVSAVLDAGALAWRLVRGYEPPSSGGGSAESGGHGVAGDPWPMAVEEHWSSVRVDGMVHATFWVAEWPRTDVRGDFLAPLLLGSDRTSFAVVMEPLGPQAAVRRTEASRTADLADAELRRRSGFVATVRHARESEVLARREAELADGHASFRFAGYVTVSAPTDEELEAASERLQHAAGQSRVVVRRLYGDQAAAWTCTLPLCRGLR